MGAYCGVRGVHEQFCRGCTPGLRTPQCEKCRARWPEIHGKCGVALNSYVCYSRCVSNATNLPGQHLAILRLLDLSDGASSLDEDESRHLADCENCREILRAFTSDRAKQLYR